MDETCADGVSKRNLSNLEGRDGSIVLLVQPALIAEMLKTVQPCGVVLLLQIHRSWKLSRFPMSC